jgi:hypothetical protein
MRNDGADEMKILIEKQADRIEALERAERVDSSIAKQLSQSMAINAKLHARIEALEATLHDAFMAMCAHRDSPDDEVLQDEIDALGIAALDPVSLLRQETTQGTAPSGSAGHGKDAGK